MHARSLRPVFRRSKLFSFLTSAPVSVTNRNQPIIITKRNVKIKTEKLSEHNVVPIVPICMHFHFFLFMVQRVLVSQDLLITEASRSHSDTPHSVGLLWTSDRPGAKTTHSSHKKETSMRPADSNPQSQPAAAISRLRSRGRRCKRLFINFRN